MLIRLLIIYKFAFIFTDPILLKRRPVKTVYKGQYRSRPLCSPNPRPGEDCEPAMCSIVVRSGGSKLGGQYATTCVPLHLKKLNGNDTTTDTIDTTATTTDTTTDTTEPTSDEKKSDETTTNTETTSETTTNTETTSKTTSEATTNSGASTDSTTITDDQTTTEKTTSDKDTTTTSNGETVITSSTNAPYDEITASTDQQVVTEIRCNGRALCKDLLIG